MANSQPQRTGSGREIAMLVGVLMLVAAGSFVTYWVRSDDAEASGFGADEINEALDTVIVRPDPVETTA